LSVQRILLNADADEETDRDRLRGDERKPARDHPVGGPATDDRGDQDGRDVVPVRDRRGLEAEEDVSGDPTADSDHDAGEKDSGERNAPLARRMSAERGGDDHRADVRPRRQCVCDRKRHVGHQPNQDPRSRSCARLRRHLPPRRS
jgi:hypothetical protein